MRFSVLDQDYVEPSVRYADIFNWHGERFKLKANQTVNMTIELDMEKYDAITADSTKGGSVIIVDQIAVLDKYLNGPAKKPFQNPRWNYVIVIHKIVESDYKNLYEKLLKKLWIDYGIANAILLSPCVSRNDVSLKIGS